MVFPPKADNMFFLRIEFRPGLVQGRDGIQFLDDSIWTMDGNIGRDDVLAPPPVVCMRTDSYIQGMLPYAVDGSRKGVPVTLGRPLICLTGGGASKTGMVLQWGGVPMTVSSHCYCKGAVPSG